MLVARVRILELFLYLKEKLWFFHCWVLILCQLLASLYHLQIDIRITNDLYSSKNKLLNFHVYNDEVNRKFKPFIFLPRHSGMPDILECEVKWALGSTNTHKTSGGDGITVQLFQILKDDVLKCCTQYASKFGKLSSGHRTRKGQFSFQSQRKTMPKNAQTTTQLLSSHTLVK